MDIDILFWLLIAALPIISGFLEKRRKQQQGGEQSSPGRAQQPPRADDAATSSAGHDGRSEELGSALDEIRRVLAGEDPETPHWEQPEEPVPHWEQPERRTAASSRVRQEEEIPHWEKPEEPVPHWEQPERRADAGQRLGQERRAETRPESRPLQDVLPDSPLLKSPENLMQLPMPAATGDIEVEKALAARDSRHHVPSTPKEIRHAIILADVLGTPRFKNRHRPF